MDRIETLALRIVQVTPKTRWSFVEIGTAAGALIGVGEATLPRPGGEGALLAAAEGMRARLVGQPANPAALAGVGAPASLPEAAILSAVDQALWDLSSRRRGEALATALGGSRRDRVPLYANINRCTVDRAPDGFAESARAALAQGFDAFKIAPFDEIVPGLDPLERPAALDRGFARIAATREAVGPDRALMVDCHWRFDEASARDVIRVAAGLSVHWVECPIRETEDSAPALTRLRRLANDLGVRLAGCEEGTGLSAFEPFLRAGAYDVMMPDVKYAGGLEEMLRIAERFAACGVGFSPHNPSGPVSHLASLHVSAAAPLLDRLEIQFDESPLFDALMAGGVPPRQGGTSRVPLGRPGLGALLDQATVAAYLAGPEIGRA